ncbi:helix-turn-helix transcriptional regulator [Paenibacillus wenxiniae]|uniref:AraC family transcriptional regulator n=1 Tax=Paenibacillus wenxiniae TaxID=1636843 RepID=A0ABW4RK52_9BACL
MSASLYSSQLADSGYRPQFYAYYYKQWQQYEMDYHQHHSTEIMYMIAGACRIELLRSTLPIALGDRRHDEVQTDVVELQRGQFIVIDAGVPHRLIVGEQPCRMLNLEFGLQLHVPPHESIHPSDTTILQQLARQETDLAAWIGQPQQYMVLSDPEEVYYTLKSLVLELDQRSMNSMLSELLFAQLLVRIARLWHEHEQSRLSQSERYVRHSIEFMRQNYDRSIRMEQIAAAVNVHPGYLHRVFRKHMETTPTDYLNTLRMEKAMMLLGSTDIPIAEIADYVGVSSRQYFHLLFKKHTSQTPADYRTAMERTQWDHVSDELSEP